MATVIQYDRTELYDAVDTLPLKPSEIKAIKDILDVGVTYDGDINSIVDLSTLASSKDLRDKIGSPKFTIERIARDSKTHRLTIHSTPSLVIDFDAKVPPRNG